MARNVLPGQLAAQRSAESFAPPPLGPAPIVLRRGRDQPGPAGEPQSASQATERAVAPGGSDISIERGTVGPVNPPQFATHPMVAREVSALPGVRKAFDRLSPGEQIQWHAYWDEAVGYQDGPSLIALADQVVNAGRDQLSRRQQRLLDSGLSRAITQSLPSGYRVEKTPSGYQLLYLGNRSAASMVAVTAQPEGQITDSPAVRRALDLLPQEARGIWLDTWDRVLSGKDIRDVIGLANQLVGVANDSLDSAEVIGLRIAFADYLRTHLPEHRVILTYDGIGLMDRNAASYLRQALALSAEEERDRLVAALSGGDSAAFETARQVLLELAKEDGWPQERIEALNGRLKYMHPQSQTRTGR